MVKINSLLELLAWVRTHKALDRAARKNRYYRNTLKEQDKAFDELQNAGLDKEQRILVDRAISAITANGAAYGEAAYRLGLHDGIRIVWELNKIK